VDIHNDSYDQKNGRCALTTKKFDDHFHDKPLPRFENDRKKFLRGFVNIRRNLRIFVIS